MRSGCSCSVWLQTAWPGNGHHLSVCGSQYVHIHTHCCMCRCVCVGNISCTHLLFSSITPNNQTEEEGVVVRYVRTKRKNEKVGNYFWIKGPVDLFLFSASPLNLQLLHSASLSSFYRPQSFPNFALAHS